VSAQHAKHPALQCLADWQTKSQVLPSHVAAAPVGGEQGEQAVPHEFTFLSSEQMPPQLWVPVGHWPLHAWPAGMHLPRHSC
jgi:hypothetical protein